MSENVKEIETPQEVTNEVTPAETTEDNTSQKPIWDELDYTKDAIIEASAGTGKTYTLQHIVLKLVKENNSPASAKNILLVTFTKKAAGELRDRIRVIFANNGCVPEDFDEMTICTIHSFCQDLLKEYAFENGVQMQTNLADEKNIQKEAISNVIKSLTINDDSYFKNFIENNRISSIADSGPYDNNTTIFKVVGEKIKEYNKAKEEIIKNEKDITEIKNRIPEITRGIKRFLDEKHFSLTTKEDFIQREIFANLEIYKKDGEKAIPSYGQLLELVDSKSNNVADEILKQGSQWLLNPKVNGQGKNAPNHLWDIIKNQDLEHFKKLYEFFEENKEIIDSYNKSKKFLEEIGEVEQLSAVPQDNKILVKYLVIKSMEEMMRIKETEAILTYNDMIERTAKIVEQESKKEKSDFLDRVRERYHIALVDEFQDTDKQQWTIFNKLFSHEYNHKDKESRFLLVVGDPKQSIYAFRGADINTYIEARKKIRANTVPQNKGSLKMTYRSTKGLIGAFNTFFNEPKWFGDSGAIRYGNVEYPLEDGKFDDTENTIEPVCLLETFPRGRDGNLGQSYSIKAFAENAALEIKEFVKKVPTEFGGLIERERKKNKVPSRFPYGIFCFLVKKHTDEYPIKKALAKYGIPFSIYKEQGLYNSIEAESILALFDFLESPHIAGNLNALLLTPFYGLQPEDLQHGKDNTTKRQEILDKMNGEWGVWIAQRKWEHLFHDFMTTTNISKPQKGDFDFDRRWTAFQQIFDDLLAQCAKTALSISDFSNALRTWKKDAEDSDLRQKENDEDRVQIMTMHASKGLEFPIVFIPAGMTGPYAQKEETIDDMKRLFYVAVTRAKYRVYLPWTTHSPENKKGFGAKDSPLQGFKIKKEKGEKKEIENPNCFLKGAIIKYFNDSPQNAVIDHSEEKGEQNKEGEQIEEKTQSPQESTTTGSKNDQESKDDPKPNDYKVPELPKNAVMRWDSFSSLVHHAPTREDDTPLPDVPSEDSPETALDTQRENDEIGIQSSEEEETQTAKSLLPRGTTSGTVFHEIMESLCKETNGLGFNIAENNFDEMAKTITPLIEGIMHRNGLEKLQDDTTNNDTIHTLARLVHYALNTEIGEDNEKFMLKDIPHSDRAAEVNFVISEKTALDEQKAPDGAFNGSIDLIVKHNEKFYIIDWKTNTLPNYSNETVKQAMDDANYHLQYKLYAVEAAKWLGPEKIAGVAYLFVRGGENGENAGTFFEKVDTKKLKEYADDILGCLPKN